MKFLLVAINYFTKWVEAERLAVITEDKIQTFVWKNIIYRFGIPRMIISDNGCQFDSKKFKEFCAELGIQNHYSSPSQLHSLVDYLPLGGRWRGFMPRALIFSSITHRVLSLCLHLSSLNLCHLISIVDVILFGLDCLSILC